MPHHNRAILSDIAEQGLDPEQPLVVAKDGYLVQSRKNKPYYPEQEAKEEKKQENTEKPKKHKDVEKPAVLEAQVEVAAVEETLPAVEPEPAVAETTTEAALDAVAEDAQATKKKKKFKVQS